MFQKIFRTKSIQKILEDINTIPNHLDTNVANLSRTLTVRDLTSLGIAAIIGAGIFSTIGTACFDGGPAVVFLFIGIAIACGFSALCYAEFSSRIPISGSAYTYSYAVFGEIIAWIIGWDLIMEYAVGNTTVAISWSGNFVHFLHGLGIDLPQYLTTSFLEAKKSIPDLYANAPKFLGIPFILNLPAFFINILITALVYIGIKESKNFANGMVVFKIIVIILVLIIGVFYINPINWQPFAPNGFSGVMKGVSAVFFAYIGFDAISTTAEECKNPQRDLPRGMIYSLIIATLLYIAVALVLTGMMKYNTLNDEAFLANAFTQKGLNWIGGLIAFSALIATASVLLVFQIGQPRIWMAMSRDGLLPKKFATIHPKYKTPSFSTIITGLLVGIPALFLDATLVTDLCSIGTLFAFMLVCGGVIILQERDKIAIKTTQEAKFKVPFIKGIFIIPFAVIAVFFLVKNQLTILPNLFPFEKGFDIWQHQIPTYIFIIATTIIILFTVIKNWSLIPVLGLLSCGYLLSTLGITNWIRFIVWLIIGLIIYFIYGFRNSKLNN